MDLNRAQRLITRLVLPLLMSGCSWLHSVDTQQGNSFTHQEIERLKEGMTIREVKNLLGTPVLNQSVLTDESNVSESLLMEDQAEITKMEYVSLSQSGSRQPIRKRVSLVFEEGKLIHFTVS